MKKIINSFLAIVMVVGVAACGTEEPRAGERTVDTEVVDDEDRTRNLVGAIGVGILTTVATNAIGMGLGAIPGMPKEISGLFGGGGADNAAVLQAIAQLAEQIRELDRKVEEVNQSVQALDSKVENLAGAVQRLAEEQCASARFARESTFKDLLILINETHDKLYGDNGVARGVIERIEASRSADTVATSDQLLELQRAYEDLNETPQFRIALPKLTESLLGAPNSSAGLIAFNMACTVSKKRFLTTNDSELWRLYGEYYIVLAAKALQLQMFLEGFDSYVEKRPLDLNEVNRQALQFEQLSRGVLFMTQNKIPRGQVLDTRSNKMWTTNGAVTTFYNALRSCVRSGNDFENIAPNAANRLDPGASERLQDCVTNSGIDSDGDARQWRIPQIYELFSSGAQTNLPAISWAPRGVVGLIDGWNDASICFGGTVRCDTPSRYLSDSGAGLLTAKFGGDIGYVWSNTSLAAVRGTRDRATNPTLVENDKAMTSRNGHANLTGYHYNGGWLSGGTLRYGFERSCQEEFNTNPKDAARFAECRRNFDADEMGPRCRAIIKGDPMPFSMASVTVANLGPKVSPLRWSSSRITGRTNPTYQQTDPGKVATFIGSQDFFWQYFTCGTLRKSCGTWSCRKWEEFNFESQLPQLGSVLMVRDLQPNERYYYLDKDTSAVKSWSERAKFEAPVVRVASDSTGRVRINTARAVEGSNVESRCTVNPATAPKIFEEFPTGNSTECSFASPFRLKPGPHVIYTMVRDTSTKASNGVVVTSLSVGGEAPPAATDVRISAENRTITFGLESMNADYDYFGEAVAVGQTQAPLRCKILPATKSCVIGALTNNTRYSATIVTQYGVLSTAAEQEEVTPFGPPTSPVAVVEKRSNGEVQLRLETPDSASIKTPVESFEVWIADQKVSTCPAEQQPTLCTVANLDNAATYDIAVKAVNRFGTTSSTGTFSVRSLAPPGVPASVSVAGTRGVINVTWDREQDGGPAASYTATAYRPDGSAAGECTSSGVTERSTTTTPPETRCDITNLDGEIAYTVKVVAVNDGGSSSAAAAKSTIRPQFVPGVPTAIATVRDTKVFVEATQGAGGSAERIRVTSTPDSLTCEIVLPATQCEIPNVRRDVSYRFTSVAVNPTGESQPSAPSNPILVYSPPSRPSIARTDNGKSRITVEMRESLTEAVDGYEVVASPGGAKCTAIYPQTSCDLVGLTNGTAYRVTVRAFNNGGFSPATDPSGEITPIAEPAPPLTPRVTLGKEQATITVANSRDTTITRYVVNMVGDNASCEIVRPATSCVITELQVGFSYAFTATAFNKIGASLPSPQTASVVPLELPLAASDVILTTNFRDIIVEILPNPDSSPAAKFEVKASPGGYSCQADAVSRKCVLQGAARGKEYTVSVKTINSGGESELFERVYYLTAPPSAPDDIDVAVSPTSLVVDVGVGGMNSDSSGVRVTASPGGKSCVITLPATTCGIDTDTSKVYTLSAQGVSVIGETSTRSVRETTQSYELRESTVTFHDATQGPETFAVSDVTDQQAAVADTAATVVDPVMGIEPSPTAPTPKPGQSPPNQSLKDIYATLTKSTLKAFKPTKFSAKVPKAAAKVCSIQKSEVVTLTSGECVIAITYTATIRDPKTKKTSKKKRSTTVRFTTTK
jgi:TolA-binding protein